MVSVSRMSLKGSIGSVGQTFLSVLLVCPGRLDRQECLSYKKIPRQTTRDFSNSEVFRDSSFRDFPSCLAVCFTWPQVALTHHVFQLCLYAPRNGPVKQVESK